MKKPFFFLKKFSYRITSLYLIFGFAWILLSDELMDLLFRDVNALSTAQTYKGIFFVLITALILFVFTKRHSNTINHAKELLERKIQDYKILYEKFLSQNHELKKAKDLAQENEDFVTGILENIPDMIFVKDAKTSKYVLVNKAVEENMGWKRSDLIGKCESDLYPAEVADKLLKETQMVLNTNASFQKEETLPTKNGNRVFFSKKLPILDHNGHPKFFLGVSEDITAKKEAERELILAKERAEESNRLKVAFLQNISHEIRTPMNAICGFTNLMIEPDLSDEQKTNYSSIIRSNCDQLLTIITDVLTISSVETKQVKVNIQEVNLNQLMDELTHIFKPTAISLSLNFKNKTNLPENQAFVLTDRTKLTQILTNLLTNALKFTKEGSIEIGCRVEQKNLFFYVKDTGIGFNPEIKDTLFERFRQANEDINKKYGGTGLGLAISKAFVELLGGQIGVESIPDKGSYFHFTIPYQPTTPVVQEAIAPILGDHGFTILIAEDEDINYFFLETLLQPMNWKLLRAKNGQEAIDIAQSDPSICLILMDIRMPIMDGYLAAIEIKKFRPDLPILAQTAYAIDNEIEKYGAVFDDYMTKPLRIDLLKQKISQFLS
ncbi:MAG TPA: ATP-binding protein [Bacteroidales bacterium]|nr:ATP-binding protein [Bacteroidales bacterium]